MTLQLCGSGTVTAYLGKHSTHFEEIANDHVVHNSLRGVFYCFSPLFFSPIVSSISLMVKKYSIRHMLIVATLSKFLCIYTLKRVYVHVYLDEIIILNVGRRDFLSLKPDFLQQII